MSASKHLNIPALSLATLFTGLIALLSFTSWDNSSSSNLHKLAGEAAFNTVTVHKVLSLKGSAIPYTATSGYLGVTGNKNHKAQIFYTAYNSGSHNRPVTFVFNGGPGSSSIWLHMGSFGPVRAVPGKAGYTNNPDTWLTFTDIVFIDPVGTGFSRPEDGTDERRFYGYQADVHSVGQFIKQYLSLNNRGTSPIFIAGESYGAARAVGLAGYLKDSLNMSTKGLTLISPALDYKLISFRKNNDTPYPYYLSAYATAAQYHKLLAPALQNLTREQLLHKVNRFAFDTYKDALRAKTPLPAAIVDTLSQYTGIETGKLTALNGRLNDTQFVRLLFADDEKLTGTYDSRDTSIVNNIDPSERKLRLVFPQALASYQKQALTYNNNLPYRATIATPKWNYGPATANDGYLNVGPALKQLLSKDKGLHVQIVSGAYDMATPAATVNQLVSNLGDTDGRVKLQCYNAGHMIYTDNEANKQWRLDTEQFYKETMAIN